jgi:hypothetical protein
MARHKLRGVTTVDLGRTTAFEVLVGGPEGFLATHASGGIIHEA